MKVLRVLSKAIYFDANFKNLWGIQKQELISSLGPFAKVYWIFFILLDHFNSQELCTYIQDFTRI